MSLRTTKFRFGPVRQGTGDKHLRQGDLIEAINVRQTAKEHVYAKRKNFGRVAQSFSGGSLSGNPTSMLPGVDGDTMMRDSGDQLWARSPTSNTFILAGTHARPWPESNAVISNLYTAPQPFSCVVGSNIWFFALTTNAYEFVIAEAATGTVIAAKQSNTATSIVHASAAYDGTYVWVFWVDNGANGTVRCHRITAATPTVAPVATNYYTFPAAPTNISTVAVQQVQARYFSAAGVVFVVACGGSLVAGTYRRACMHSVLDPATGLAVAAGARAVEVVTAYNGAVGTHTVGALYILDGQDGSGATWYYTVSGDVVAPWNADDTYLLRVSAAGFVTYTWVQLAAGAVPARPRSSIGIASSTEDKQYVISTNWYSSVNVFGAALLGPSYQTRLHHIAAGVATTRTLGKPYDFAWPASGFAKVGTRWYALTGFDDYAWACGQIAIEANSLQRSFHVREFVPGATVNDSTFNVLAQFKIGDGAALWHRASGALVIPAGTPIVTCSPPMHVSGTTLIAASAIRSGVTGYVDLAQTRVQTDKVYGKDCQAMGRGFTPGNIPVVWNSQCPAHEISPLTNPCFIAVTGGAGADFVIAAACYAIYDNDGVVWRSSPFVLNATVGNGATLTIPVQRQYLGTTVPFKVEVYLGTTPSAKLQTVLTPITGQAYVTHVTPLAAAMVNGEVLYTTGNALSNTWPVACQAIAHWRNRVILAQGADVWASMELETGFGPLFNEVQVSKWSEETGEITAMAPIDWNYLALLSEKGAGAITGAGPDGVGNGNFVVQNLSTQDGCAAGAPATQGPQGCYYQHKNTGRIICITPALQAFEAADGAYDYSSYVITAAAWYDSENLMVFSAPASKAVIAIDYQHPTDVAPFGKTYLWTFTTLAAYAAAVDTIGLALIDAAGAIYRPGTAWADEKSGGTETYQMRITTGQLQPGDLQGEFDVSMVQVLLALQSATGVTITTYPGYASRTLADARVTSKSVDLTPTNVGDAATVMTRPSNCARIQGLSVRITEKAAVSLQSFEFEGLAIEFATASRLMYPQSGRVI